MVGYACHVHTMISTFIATGITDCWDGFVNGIGERSDSGTGVGSGNGTGGRCGNGIGEGFG